jgi:lysophospholipase L1-like esterase
LFFPDNIDRQSIALHVKQDLPGLQPEILYERDALGLRRLSLNPNYKPADAIRILCVGASTTDQPTQDTANTWCGMLQLKLTELFSDRGVGIETATLAQGGWRVPDLVARINDRIDTLQPDIVIVLMGINDLAFNGGPGYVYTGLSDRLAAIGHRDSSLKSSFWGRCEAVSYLCQRLTLLRKMFHDWRLRRAGQVLEWHSQNIPVLRQEYQQYHYVDAPKRDPDPLREFEDGMEHLLGLLDRHSADAIVLGQPVLWKENMSEAERTALWFYVETPAGRVRPSGRWLVTEMARYNAAQHTIAQKHGVRFLDLDARIPKDLDHYFDDCHFTDLGSRWMADEVLPHVAATVHARLSRYATQRTPQPHVDSLPSH